MAAGDGLTNSSPFSRERGSKIIGCNGNFVRLIEVEAATKFERLMSKAKVGEDLWKNRVEKVVFLLKYCEWAEL